MDMVMTSRTVALLAVVIAVIVVLGGIGVYLLMRGGDTGEISIYVKDAPEDDWKYMNVTFSSVAVHKADADSDNNTAANATDEGGEWINVPLEQETIDLMSYVDVSALLAAGNISTGKYTQIRIIVDSVVGTLLNGTEVEFKVPSGELKEITMFTIEEDEATKLTVDIDLKASIVYSASGEWIFTPVLGEITES